MTNRYLAHAAVLTLAAAGLLGACKPAAPVEAARQTAAAPAAGMLTVQAQPDLGAAFQAMPRFTGGDAAATAKINAAMVKLDASGKENLTLCPDQPNAQSQTVKVLRNGPDFIAVEVSGESDCGAYPSGGVTDYVFDARTGDLVDWSKLIPGAAIRNGEPDPDYYTSLFTSAEFTAREMKAARAETDKEYLEQCVPALEQGELSFSARFNDDEGTLQISPDLVHAIQACGVELQLTPADLTALHADPRLIAAVGKR
jgi:hypothetical protein